MTKKSKPLLTAASIGPDPSRLRDVFIYCPLTGDFTWKSRPRSDFKTNRDTTVWNVRFSGTPAGIIRADGYARLCLDARHLMAHRVAWAMYYGEWPSSPLDHINGIRDDNRIANLRLSSAVENGRNCKRSRRNKSGVTGVAWSPGHQRWLARIGESGRTRHIGCFSRKSDAITARKAADIELNFSPRHGS